MKRDAQILDRLPPNNINDERAVLGSILKNPAVIDEVAAIVMADDFYNIAHQKLFATFLAMRHEGTHGDILLVVNRLKMIGADGIVGSAGDDIGPGYEERGAAFLAPDLESCSAAIYLKKLLSTVVTHAHAAHYARAVQANSKLRAIIYGATEALSRAYEDGASADEIAGRYAAEFDDIANRSGIDSVRTAEQAAEAACGRIAQLTAGRGTAMPLGIAVIDDEIGGAFPDELVIVAARPGDGKTSLGLQMAVLHAAAESRVLFFSTEMSAGDLFLRAACSAAQISGNGLRAGTPSPTLIEQVTSAVQNMAPNLTGLLIDDSPRISIADITRTALKHHRQHPLKLIVVDYLGRISPSDPRRPRHEQVGQIARDLKTLARKLNLPVVCLAQLNRQTGSDGRPGLANLRESGDCEAEADQVWILYQPGKANPRDADLQGKVEFIVAKNRNGPTSFFNIFWDAELTTFRSGPPSQSCDADQFVPYNDNF